MKREMKKINNLFSYSKKPIKERQNKSKSGRKKENNTDKSRSQWNWNNRTTEKKKVNETNSWQNREKITKSPISSMKQGILLCILHPLKR